MIASGSNGLGRCTTKGETVDPGDASFVDGVIHCIEGHRVQTHAVRPRTDQLNRACRAAREVQAAQRLSNCLSAAKAGRTCTLSGSRVPPTAARGQPGRRGCP